MCTLQFAYLHQYFPFLYCFTIYDSDIKQKMGEAVHPKSAWGRGKTEVTYRWVQGPKSQLARKTDKN